MWCHSDEASKSPADGSVSCSAFSASYCRESPNAWTELPNLRLFLAAPVAGLLAQTAFGLSPRTVANHRQRIYGRLGVANQAAATVR